MSNYTLSSITMKNFKLFGPNGYHVNFSKDKLIVFDGPNGYGKTTVFDAIELALTGGIKRFHQVESQSPPKDVVVAHNNSKNVEVMLELSGPQTITIIRRLKKNLPRSANKIKNFRELWDLSLLDKQEEKQISEESFRELICMNNIERDFNLFHYVQQEDTAHFLKSNNEKGRAEAITELFGDTKKEKQNLEKLNAVGKIMNALCKKIEGEKKEVRTAYGLSDSKIDELKSTEETYKCLLPWLQVGESLPEWDRKEIHKLTPQKRDKIVGDLKKIQSLVIHRDVFPEDIKYESIAGAQNLHKSFILCSKYFEEFENLKIRAQNKATLVEALSKLTIENAEEIATEVDVESICALISYSKGKDFTNNLHDLNVSSVKNIGNNQLYSELIEYRDATIKKFNQTGEADISDCPMCGTIFDKRNLLLTAISQKGDFYKSLLDDDSKKLLAQKDAFKKTHLQPFFERIMKFVNELNAPEPKLLEEIKRGMEHLGRIMNLKKWLENTGVEFLDLCCDYQPEMIPEVEIERRLQVFIDRIETKKPTLNPEYLQAKEEYYFKSLYETFFQSNLENLFKIDIFDISKKIGYVQSLYYGSVEQQLEKLQLLDKKIESLKKKQTIVNDLKQVVRKEIRSYQKKMITDIEIPFFLYSGKILQTHQAGVFRHGVFLKDPVASDELKNIRLVANWDSEHDILNTMSSGQIAAVVISLTLALNRVYSKNLNTILVDDPVQTMDDINMISFVELLRNEFSDKQVIFSTHEDNISRYFLYKYLKHGHSVRKVNLMERKEYQLNC